MSWMRRRGLARVRVSSTMLWLEWPGRRGIRTRQIRVCRGRCPGGAVHGYRGRYLAKECVGSNRAVKRTIATSRSEATTTGTVPDNETKVRAQESLPPHEPEENAKCAPALPLRSQPEENRFCLTISFRNGHIDRGIRRHLRCRDPCGPLPPGFAIGRAPSPRPCPPWRGTAPAAAPAVARPAGWPARGGTTSSPKTTLCFRK